MVDDRSDIVPDGKPTQSQESFAVSDGMHDRRSFLKRSTSIAAGVLAGKLSTPATGAELPAKTEQPPRLVRFGQTDLFVTRYCQGTAFREIPRTDNPEARRILHRCIDVGINFFDSAEAYGWGGSETVLGKVIAGRRDQVIICTKAAPGLAPVRDPNSDKFKLGEQVTFTRKSLFRKAEGSLKRLGTDYIDLYLLHSPDQAGTPPEEISDTMNALVKAGKIRYWGLSNFKAGQIEDYYKLGKSKSDQQPVAGTEDYYNVAARERFEPDMPPVFRRTGLGLMAFSPQDTGKLAPGRPVKSKALVPLIDALDEVARELDAGRPQVCIAWTLAHAEVTTVLGGAESPEHVEENIGGTTLTLSAEALAKLNAASDKFLAYKRQKMQNS
jgi:aryl-alcohol dehydrogenase-like predicted oxidoreductase